ncbi:MAG: QueT transporter family protein [Clostridiales bacterium]|nr:QueT transporter family protein [Clostridiales bacterium]
MRTSKYVLWVVQAAVIAALYVTLTYLQEAFLPGTTSMAVQFRVSEVLTILALYTPAAIPGLTVGCILANLVSVGALPVDMILGPLATLMATWMIYRCRNLRWRELPLVSALMPALFNGAVIGLEIEIFFIEGPFHVQSFLIQGGLVALGELGVLFILGVPFARVMERRGLDKRLFVQEPSQAG